MPLVPALTDREEGDTAFAADVDADFELLRQYINTYLLFLDVAKTVVAQHTFNPAAPGAPFVLGANALGQLVAGLNAQYLGGQTLASIQAIAAAAGALELVQYRPGVDTPFVAGLAFADVDAVNASITFTPTTTRTLLRITALQRIVSAGDIAYWNLREGVADLANTDQMMLNGPGSDRGWARLTYEQEIVTVAGVARTIKMGTKASSTPGVNLWVGPSYGNLVISAWAL